MKPTRITASIKPNAGELVQVSVEFPGMAYPQVINEMCVKVRRRLMHDLTADQIKTLRRARGGAVGG